jgi:ATP-dependent RNA helicase DHX8/PRP22
VSLHTGNADEQYPELLDDNRHDTIGEPEIEEELDIEVNDIEPSFLSGQTKVTLELSPVKIIKAPDGYVVLPYQAYIRTLNRAAMAGASLAKERRDLKRMEANDQADSDARDVNTAWLDPMAASNDKQFASDVRVNAMGQKIAQPAWKAGNKAISYGKITSLSIQDQRRSLPIFKLRDQLVQAIKEVSSSHTYADDRTKSSSSSVILDRAKPRKWRNISLRKACWSAES